MQNYKIIRIYQIIPASSRFQALVEFRKMTDEDREWLLDAEFATELVKPGWVANLKRQLFGK